MESKVLDSIVEITKQRDSDALGISILATIAELLPSCYIALYRAEEFPSYCLKLVSSLAADKDDDGVKQYIWDAPVPIGDSNYILSHVKQLQRLTIYHTDDGRNHIFIPIVNSNNDVVYALDISSIISLSRHLETLLAISKVCENFYAILSASERDTLTGLFNRSTFENKLNSLLSRQYFCQLAGQEEHNNERKPCQVGHTWLAIIDIDYFKRVNDQYGHIYGDEVLLVLAQTMKRSFRANDLLFRFGGEEFVIIFEPIEKKDAEIALNKFMEIVRNQRFPMVGHITISCGYAKITAQDHPKTILDNADKALYFAKDNGRDCLYNYEELFLAGKVNSVNQEGDIELF